MEYLDEGMFPGMAGLSFKMTANNIDKESIQKMMNTSASIINLEQVKETFEYFLKVSIKDCIAKKKKLSKKDKLYEIEDALEKDYLKAYVASKKLSVAEFLQAKIKAQDYGIVTNINRYEAMLNDDSEKSVDDIESLSGSLLNYQKDRALWDSLSANEKLFFVAKSMANYEKQNLEHYQNIEKENQSKNTFANIMSNIFKKKSENTNTDTMEQ